MSNNRDWLPGRRADVLALAKNWISQLGLHASAWGVPQAEVTELSTLTSAADAALAVVESAAKTEGAVRTCQTAFEALDNKLRYIKKRWFLVPPLSPTDLANLELPEPDDTPSDIPAPVDQAGVEVVKWAPHSFGLRLYTQADMGGDKAANYGVRVYYAPVEPGGTGEPAARRGAGEVFILSAPPESPADLPNSFFTRRQHEDLLLPPEFSGKPCYFAARYENSKGAAGPWGLLIQATIP